MDQSLDSTSVLLLLACMSTLLRTPAMTPAPLLCAAAAVNALAIVPVHDE